MKETLGDREKTRDVKDKSATGECEVRRESARLEA